MTLTDYIFNIYDNFNRCSFSIKPIAWQRKCRGDFFLIIFCSQCIAMSVGLSSSSSTHLLFGTVRAYITSSCWNDEHFCKSFTKLQSKCQKKIPKQNSNNIMIRNRIFHDFSQERTRKYSFLIFFQETTKGIVKRKNSHKMAP